MPWIRRNLRGTKVYVRADDTGKPLADAAGRVDVVYKLSDAAKTYRAALRNLAPTGDPDDDRPLQPAGGEREPSGERAPAKARTRAADAPAGVPPDAIIIYTDGACTGNPGPMGTGVVMLDGSHRWEHGEYLGIGTNNIAELTAIEQALRAVPKAKRHRPVLIHTDSSYSIGVLSKGWKAKANQELIARIRKLQHEFDDLRYVKVRGHAGIPENERCDQLARDAITSAR